MTTTPPDNWTKFDFLALVLIYASHADLQMVDAEIEWIQSQIGEDHFSNALALYEKQSDFQNVQSISQMKDTYFPGEDGTKELQKYLSSLFMADQDFSHLEDLILQALKRLF